MPTAASTEFHAADEWESASPALALLAKLEARLTARAGETPAPRIAVLLPCYNEEAAVAGTVLAFKAALPGADVYVYDNNSTDRTVERATEAGATVRREPHQGKGNVVRRMFADIDADIYVLADGDMTYDPSAAPQLVEHLVAGKLDMVIGARIETAEESYRRGHRLGNRVFNLLTAVLFKSPFNDIFSGYRVFSRRFVKSFPAASSGFEIESELTVHALELRLLAAEVPLPYGKRPENSVSKLKTYRDGFRILRMLFGMYRMVAPFRFYGAIAAALALLSLALGLPVIETWLDTGLVPRLPTAILAAAIAQLSVLMLVCGLIVESFAETRREIKRFKYLDHAAPSCS